MVLTLVLWALIGLLLQVCGREGEDWVHSPSLCPSSPHAKSPSCTAAHPTSGGGAVPSVGQAPLTGCHRGTGRCLRHLHRGEGGGSLLLIPQCRPLHRLLGAATTCLSAIPHPVPCLSCPPCPQLVSQLWSRYDVTVRTVFLTLYVHLEALLALHSAATQVRGSRGAIMREGREG